MLDEKPEPLKKGLCYLTEGDSNDLRASSAVRGRRIFVKPIAAGGAPSFASKPLPAE
jgi:hypothetical protein